MPRKVKVAAGDKFFDVATFYAPKKRPMTAAQAAGLAKGRATAARNAAAKRELRARYADSGAGAIPPPAKYKKMLEPKKQKNPYVKGSVGQSGVKEHLQIINAMLESYGYPKFKMSKEMMIKLSSLNNYSREDTAAIVNLARLDFDKQRGAVIDVDSYALNVLKDRIEGGLRR